MLQTQERLAIEIALFFSHLTKQRDWERRDYRRVNRQTTGNLPSCCIACLQLPALSMCLLMYILHCVPAKFLVVPSSLTNINTNISLLANEPSTRLSIPKGEEWGKGKHIYYDPT